MTGLEEAIVKFNRTVRDPGEVNSLLLEAYRTCHLISPATSCGDIPEGFSVALSMVILDIERETYPSVNGDDDGAMHGDRSIGKVALDRIANAAAVSWSRKDSGVVSREANYVHYKAVGTYPHFDNVEKTIADEKEIDLREGSAYIQQLRERARRKGRNPDLQIMQERVHILSNAITKARLRALRELGIRTSYRHEELMMPFVVARLMRTGRSNDPALQREFALMQMRASFASARSLYDEPTEPSQSPNLREPPPVESTAPEEEIPDPDVNVCAYCGTEDGVDELSTDGGTILACRKPSCVEAAWRDGAHVSFARGTPSQSHAQPTPAASSVPPRDGAAGARAPGHARQPGVLRGSTQPLSGHTIPGGDERGVPLEKASDGSLRFWERRIDARLQSGETPARHVASDRKLLEAIRAEFARRNRDDNIPY